MSENTSSPTSTGSSGSDPGVVEIVVPIAAVFLFFGPFIIVSVYQYARKHRHKLQNCVSWRPSVMRRMEEQNGPATAEFEQTEAFTENVGLISYNLPQ